MASTNDSLFTQIINAVLKIINQLFPNKNPDVTPTPAPTPEPNVTPVPNPTPVTPTPVNPTPTPPEVSRFPLRTSGGKIVDAQGKTVVLTGASWFGMESNLYVPHLLWTRNWKDMLDQFVSCGFNSIRLPYSNQLFDSTSVAGSLDTVKNADLVGKTGWEVMQIIVKGATDRGLMVILDRHRPDSNGQSELWQTDHVSEAKWISDWVMLANFFKDNPRVIGADLQNEPHGSATWGDSNFGTDWRLAAQRCGNAIQAVNPNWLIIVEGVENYQGKGNWWGGNLIGAKGYPVRLNVPNKLVYSAHEYGPIVWDQSWFHDSTFPNNLPARWDEYFGYLVKQNIAPVWIGEFGAKAVDLSTIEGVWITKFVEYMKTNGMSYAFWAFNGNSADTGGILQDDAQSVHPDKLALLKTYMTPRI